MMSVVRRAGADRVFQQFLDSAPDTMLGVAPSGRIVVANGQAEVIFGLSRSSYCRTFGPGPYSSVGIGATDVTMPRPPGRDRWAPAFRSSAFAVT